MPSSTMQRLENIKLLQNALTDLKSASGFLARANAAKALTDVLTKLGYLGAQKTDDAPAGQAVQAKSAKVKRQDIVIPTTATARQKANNAAVELLAKIQNEGLTRTDLSAEQLEVLAKYTGSGGGLTAKDGRRGSAYEYYTPIEVAESMWDLAKDLGFSGGKVLDPSAGTGIFAATSPDSAVVDSIELDSISGSIAQVLNDGDNSNTTVSPFEAQAGAIADDSLDMVMTNVPFGNNSTRGKNKLLDDAYQNESLENYFILRSLEKIKAGGLAIFITPTSVVSGRKADKTKLRKLTSLKAEFLGAYRLPNSVFEQTGADVVTDVVVYRKHSREAIEQIKELYDAGNLKALTDSKVLWEEYLSGHYFKGAGKKFVLGDTIEVKDRFSKLTEKVVSTKKTPEIAKMMKRFGDSRIDWDKLGAAKAEFISYKNGDTVFQNGKQLEYKDGAWVEIESFVTDTDREIQELLAGMGNSRDMIAAGIGFNDAMQVKNYCQQTGQMGLIPEQVMAWLKRCELGVAENKRAAAWNSALCADAIRDAIATHDYGYDFKNNDPQLTAFIKTAFLDGKNSKLTGDAGQDHKFIALYYDNGKYNAVWRGDIDTTIQSSADSASYQSRLAKMQYENKSLFVTLEQLKQIHPDIDPLTSDDWFINHDGSQVIAASDFLTGSLSARLKDIDAQISQAIDDSIIAKLQKQKLLARESVTRIDLQNVDFDLRSPLISAEDKVRFLKQSVSKEAFVSFDEYGKGTPDIDIKGSNLNDIQKLTNRIGDWLTKGTVTLGGIKLSRMTERAALDWLTNEINTANVKFNSWVKANDNLMAALNDKMNNDDNLFFSQNSDESPIDIAGMNPKLNLHGYQNAYVRSQGRFFGGINGFGVGLGKTFTSLASVQHTQNIGAKKKTLFVVPNSVLSNWRKEAGFAYQNTDDCLFVGLREKGDKFRVFSNKYDEDLLKAIDGKYRKIFLTFEAFKRIRLKETTLEGYAAYIQGSDAAFAHHEVQKKDEKAQGLTASLIKKLDMKTNAPFLEDMRIDSVVIDEAHAFKNSIGAPNTSGRVKYLSQPDESARGEDAQAKLWYIRSLTGNNDGVQLLTATPITNSPLEIYSMLSLAGGRDTVNRMFGGIDGADDFLSVTCQIDEEVVPTIDGRERSQNVFTGIKNAQILRKAVQATATIEDADSVGMSVVIPSREEVATKVQLDDKTRDALQDFQNAYKTARMIEKDDFALRTMDDDDPLNPNNPLSAYNKIAARYGETNELMAHPFNLIRKMDVMIADSDFSDMVTFYDVDPSQAAIANKVIEQFNKKGYKDERKRLSPFTDSADATEIYKKDNKETLLVGYKVNVKADVLLRDGRERIMIDTLDSKLQSSFEALAEKAGLNLDVSISPKVAAMLENFKTELASPRGINSDGTTSKIVKQIIFCDHLFLHNKIKRILAKQAGISSNKITIITGQTNNEPDQMIDIQDGFNAEGEDNQYQVIIANKKAEVGINLQKGTQAIHHLTTGWTPDSLEQRNGRGARQGNKTESVKIYHYDADGTFDEFKRTMIDKKDEWITSVLSNDAGNTIEVSGSITREEQDALIRLGGNQEAIREYQANRDAEEVENRRKLVENRRKINMAVVNEQLRILQQTRLNDFFEADLKDIIDLVRANHEDKKKINNPKSSDNVRSNAQKRYDATKAIVESKLRDVLDAVSIQEVDDRWQPMESKEPLAPKVTTSKAYAIIESKITEYFANKDSSSWERRFKNRVLLSGFEFSGSQNTIMVINKDGLYQAAFDEATTTAKNLIKQSLLSANKLAKDAGLNEMQLPTDATDLLVRGEAQIIGGHFVMAGMFVAPSADDKTIYVVGKNLQAIGILKQENPNRGIYFDKSTKRLADNSAGMIPPGHPDYLDMVKRAAAIEDEAYAKAATVGMYYSDALPMVAEYRDGSIKPNWSLKNLLLGRQDTLKNAKFSLMLPLKVLDSGSNFANTMLAEYKNIGIDVDLENQTFRVTNDSITVEVGGIDIAEPNDDYWGALWGDVIASKAKISAQDVLMVRRAELVALLSKGFLDDGIKAINETIRGVGNNLSDDEADKLTVKLFDDYLFDGEIFESKSDIPDETKIDAVSIAYMGLTPGRTGSFDFSGMLIKHSRDNAAKQRAASLTDTDVVEVSGDTMSNKDTIKEYADRYGTPVRGSRKYVWHGKKKVWMISFGAWVKMISDNPALDGELIMEAA